jgi:AhpD family alkylhydroperoxidase
MQQLEIWQAWSAGQLDDATAQQLSETAYATRARHKGQWRDGLARPLQTGFANPRRRPCRSPDKQASRERRDMLAAMAALSPLMAVGFAVIAVVVMLAMRVSGCIACHEEIAARAGVSVSTVKRALAKARQRGLLDRRERRRPGRPSLSNVVRIRDRDLRENAAPDRLES